MSIIWERKRLLSERSPFSLHCRVRIFGLSLAAYDLHRHCHVGTIETMSMIEVRVGADSYVAVKRK